MADTLKSSFSPAGWAIAATMPGGHVVHVGERARLLARAEDLERPLPRERLADQVGHGVGDPGLVLGQLAGPVGVEGPADREGKAVLVVEGAAVDLAGQLGEPVRGARGGTVEQVLLGGGELGGALEHHRRGHVHQALDALVERRPEDAVVEAGVHLEQRVRQPVEVGDAADDRGQVDHVRAARHGLARLGGLAQVAGVDLAGVASSRRGPDAGRTRARRGRRPRAAAAPPRRRWCRHLRSRAPVPPSAYRRSST